MIADLRTAVAFLTRLPVGASRSAPDLSRAALWFPAVGLLVGGLLGGVRLLADLALDPLPATLLALLAAVLVTGALHEDGLADVADGMGAHVARERRLEIFKDSRVGTFGGLAIAFMVAFPLVTLAPLDGEHVLRAALAAHVLARWTILPQSWLLPPAAAGGSGRLVRASPLTVALGSLYSAALVLAAAGLGPGLLACGAAAGLTLLGGAWFRARLGGVTGDTYGAVAKVVELAVYVALGAAFT